MAQIRKAKITGKAQKIANASRLLQQAEKTFQSGQIQQAKECLYTVLQYKPQHWRALNDLGVILFQENNFVEAEKYFRQSLKSKPQNLDALLNLIQLYWAQKQYIPALMCSLKTFRRFHKHAEAKSILLEVCTGIVQQFCFSDASTLEQQFFHLRSYPKLVSEIEEIFEHKEQWNQHFTPQQCLFLEATFALMIKNLEWFVLNLSRLTTLSQANLETIVLFAWGLLFSNYVFDAVFLIQQLSKADSQNKVISHLQEEYRQRKSNLQVQQLYRRILIIMDQGIGNMVMLTPTIRALKRSLPDSEITVLGRQPALQILAGWDAVKAVVTEPPAEHFDLGFFTIWSQDFAQKYGEQIKGQCRTVYQMQIGNPDVHESDHYFEIARILGFEDEKPEPFCATQKADVSLPANKKIVALADTTLNNNGWERKRWPYYSQLAHELIKQGYAVVLIGGEEEAARFRPEQWPSEIINCLGRFDLPQTADILRKCDLFIGNDSGPAHMAAALGVETYVIFGPTRVKKNKPLGKKVTVINKNLPCSPCQYTERWQKCTDWRCMSQISVEEVLRAVVPQQQEKKIVASPIIENAKKILIVGVLDVPSSTNVFMKKGFEKVGFQVDAYNYRTRMRQLGTPDKMWNDFQQFLNGKRYELIIFSKVNNLHPELVTYASRFGKTWYWFMDNLGLAKRIHADEYAKRADFVSATSEEVSEWFQKVNPNTFQIIEGFDPDTYFHEDLPKVYDLLFVGNATEKRINDLRLLRNGQMLTVFGNGWPPDFDAKPPIYNEELRKAICQSKIVLNLVHSNIFSDRVILTAASGGFVLSQACPDLRKHFRRKRHLDWFRTADEAQRLINYYLTNEKEREKIARSGMRYVRRKYSWKAVCSEILEKSQTLPPRIVKSQERVGQRVLFVSWHGLGDNVMLTPALRKYKQLHPNDYIAVAGLERFGESLVQLLSGLPFIDEVIPCLPDAWNDFGDYKVGVEAVMQKAQAVGKEKDFSKVVMLPTNRQRGYKLHKIFRFADEVGVQFKYLEDLQTELAVSKEAEKRVEEFIRDYPKPILVLHTKAGNQPKTLSSENVEKILGQYEGYTVFEFGRRSTSRSILIPEDDMEFSKALIKRADMVIAIDSVVMHIAGAFRRPLLAIFTVTPVHQAIPLSYRIDVIGVDNQQTQLSRWPKLKKEIQIKFPRREISGYDERWYFEGGSSCYQGYWWGERGGMGENINRRMLTIINSFPDMFQGKKILDVGCAAGYYVKVMRDCGYEAYGCDPSNWIINREETLMTPYKKYLKVGTAQKIPFENKIDTVLALNVLEHCDENELSSFLSELNRLKTTNLVIQVPQIDDPEAFIDPTHKLIKPLEWWNEKFASIGFHLVKNIPYVGAPIWYYQRFQTPIEVTDIAQKAKRDFYVSKDELPAGLTQKVDISYYNERVNFFKNAPKNWTEYEAKYYSKTRYKDRLLKAIAGLDFRPKERVLELVCNDGKTAIWLGLQYPQIQIDVIDALDVAIDFVKRVNPCQNIRNFTIGNIAELERYYSPNSYDKIFCIDVIEHLDNDDYLKMIKGMYAVLKPGGVAIVFGGVTPQPEHIHIIPVQQIASDFLQAGFQLQETKNINGEIFQIFNKPKSITFSKRSIYRSTSTKFSHLKLPDFYHHPLCYWAHMITFRCNGGCPFCILNGRGKRQKSPELSGKEILDFWNNIEHRPGQKLSLIGGEPTLHPDIVEIVNNLEGYDITITTNCKGPFYEDPNFYKKFKPHPSSNLRINTTFHPHFISAEDYIRVIKLYRETGYFVDQTSYVYHPDINQYQKAIDKVSKEIQIKATPYLGFYDPESKFQAPFLPKNIEPNENYYDLEAAATICGLTDLDAYRDMCGQYEKRQVICEHPLRSLIIGPEGNYYHCHYKLYYGIDPVCNINNFKPVTEESKDCRHYGFCNWCDVPRVGCTKNPTATQMVLNKLYDKREFERSEIQHLIREIDSFAREHNLEFNPLKWFEYSYAILYSGHRHRGKVLDVGSAKSIFPYYLAAKGYDVTTIDIADFEYRTQIGRKFGVKCITGDLRVFHPELEGKFDLITNLSVIEHIDEDTEAVLNLAKYLKPGGIMVISTDFYERYIEYPDANRTIVRDRPPDSLTDSRVYTEETFLKRIIVPLEKMGVVRLGLTNYQNVDIMNPQERSVRGLYTFGIACLRKSV